jgi:hypothetical protein
MRRKITNETWEQIKTGYAAGINLREIARKMKIPEGTVLAHAKRHGWTQQIQAATGQLAVVQSDAITPVQPVPQSLAGILAERRERTKLGLSKYAAEAAEQAALHRDKLGIAGKVKDVAGVHRVLWPEDQPTNQILNVGILTGEIPIYDARTGLDMNGKSFDENVAAGRDSLERWGGTSPCSHLLKAAKAKEIPPDDCQPLSFSPGEKGHVPEDRDATQSQSPPAPERVLPEDQTKLHRIAARVSFEEKCRYWRSER